MALMDANGHPIGQKLQAAAAQQPEFMGCAVFKKNASGVLIPAVTPKGDFAIFPDMQSAQQAAGQFANQELLPNPEKKVVTPQMVSSKYVLVLLHVFGEVQAKIKNPEQLLAQDNKSNG
jgi:hypothetical protein